MCLMRVIDQRTSTIETLASKFNLNINTLRSWRKRYIQRGYLLGGDGRTEAISEKYGKWVLAKIRDRTFQIRREEYMELLHEATLKSAQDLDPMIVSVPPPSRSTILRFEKEMKIKSALGEVITPSRHLAVCDIYNAVSFFVMNYVMMNVLNIFPGFCVNADATQFCCGGRGDETVEVKFVDDQVESKKSRSLKTTAAEESPNDGIIKYFIKFYLIISNGACMAPPIYMLADDNMDEDELRVYKVPMLGIGTNLIDNYGYVVISKTRCANIKFYKWLYEFVLIPFIVNLRNAFVPLLAHNLKKNYCTDAWFQLDGEAVQIEIFKTKNMQNLLAENKIHVGKPPGSTTAITQPCDYGNCFRGPKTTNKHLADSDVKNNEIMLNVLSQIFASHNVWLNSDERGDRRQRGRKKSKSSTSSSEIAMNPAHVNMARHGILRVQYAMSKSMNAKTIRESFDKVGLTQTGANFDTILNNWKSNCGEEDRQKIWNKMDTLVEKFLLQGELFENDLESLEIDPNVERRGKSVDLLTLNRRRSCLLTHDSLIAREDSKEMKETKIIETRKRKRQIDEEQEIIVIN